jgi:hypothetical protein
MSLIHIAATGNRALLFLKTSPMSGRIKIKRGCKALA